MLSVEARERSDEAAVGGHRCSAGSIRFFDEDEPAVADAASQDVESSERSWRAVLNDLAPEAGARVTFGV